jgi:hypothetical protein
MNLSTLDNVLWAASFFGNVALFFVLIYRGRWREFQIFTSLIGFDSLLTVGLFAIYSHGARTWYTRVYWSSVIVDFGLQLGVVFELVRVVLRPTGTWVRDARKQFLLWGATGAMLAMAMAWIVSPPAAKVLDALEVRGNLFTSLLICELFIVMTITSNRLGLAWRSHVMALAQGLTAWATVAVVIDALHSYLGAQRDFSGLEHARMFVYLAALGYWIVQLWRPEPERQPLSPEMRKYIVALHSRVQYDLSRAKQ